MNTAPLKKYGPQARKDFLSGVSDRAAKIGLYRNGRHEPVEVRGDFAIMGGRSYPKIFASQRKKLEDRITKTGFDAVLESAAYTWFNRFMAIRYMEVQGFLDHGFRVFSHPDGKPMPEILEQAQNVTLPGLNREEIVELKLDGSKDEQLYRLLLLGQCRSLNQAMPFLFESIDDATELLLPDNLLATDSVVRKLATEIEEDSWTQIEIIGWLYQFYISDEKARVDALVKKGKSVAPEDIPAKTQIFTPNWVVKYLVQNSLGKLWLEISPSSALKDTMRYFVEKPAQLPEVQVKLDQLAQDQREKHKTPETITFIDPCAGSGHILVEAYDLFKAFYEERGYAKRDIPKLILEKNLYGLEIDDRAAQIAGFALMMKARADDRSIFSNAPHLNVFAIQSSEGLDAALVGSALAGGPTKKATNEPEPVFAPTSLLPELDRHPTLVASTTPSKPSLRLQEQFEVLLDSFLEAKTFGSLIRVPKALDYKQIAEALHANQDSARGFGVSDDLKALLAQTALLAESFDVMVTNPPYLGGKAMTKELKDFAKDNFPNTKSDLFAMFMERGFDFVVANGYTALVTMQSWMFLSSYDEFRQEVLENTILGDMVHMGNGVMGIAFGTAATIFKRAHLPHHSATYSYCEMGDIGKDNRPLVFPVTGKRHCSISQAEFKKIPGWPVVYWVSANLRRSFVSGKPLIELARPCQGMATTNNSLFVRNWFEVSVNNIGFGLTDEDAAEASRKKWFPYNKGGEFRKWYGNQQHIVNFEHRGQTICDYIDSAPEPRVGSNGRVINRERFFKQSVSWSKVSSGQLAARFFPEGFIFDVAGCSIFAPDEEKLLTILAFINSKVAHSMLAALSPTLNYEVGQINALPILTE
jgi:Eco57I restriction-modification methylase